MAQPQHQVQMPPRSFSGSPHPATSPAAMSPPTQPGYPPAKRPRLDTQYSAPPSTTPTQFAVASPSTAASPTPSAVQSPVVSRPQQPAYNTPYPQTATNANLSMPAAPGANNQNFTGASFTPASGPMPTPTSAQPVTTPGASFTSNMGPPPTKAAEKPSKEETYSFDDALAGTGISLDAEFQALANQAAAAGLEGAHTGFPQLPAGPRESFYGAGLLNQPPVSVGSTQDEYLAQVARNAWDKAAYDLARTRTQELNQPFLEPAVISGRLRSVCSENGLSPNSTAKSNQNTSIGRWRAPDPTNQPVTVGTRNTGDGNVVIHTSGEMWDGTVLADLMALLSIATRERIRDLMSEAYKISRHRQDTSHHIPDGWQDAATAIDPRPASVPSEGSENAASPSTAIPAKRSADGTRVDAKPSNHFVSTLREISKSDRNAEEARLLRREKRANKDTSAGPSRSGSVAPGTPGTVAPEPEARQMSKKELKKIQRQNELATAASVNTTTSHFLTQFGSKKRKQKKYDWMNSGGSGASTPRPSLGTASLSGPVAPPAPAQLTSQGAYSLGAYREDSSKGKGIQIRDWVHVLENDRRETRALQFAYDKLDTTKSG